jgi:hypothetical protein
MLTRPARADSFMDPCIPSWAPKPPAWLGWVHEIKQNGYRLIVRRAVQLFTRSGHDRTERIRRSPARSGCDRTRLDHITFADHQTNIPSGPVWKAAEGTVRAPRSTSSDTFALTRSPGQSCSSSLANIAFMR